MFSKILKIIPTKLRINCIYLIAFILVGTFLEILGLGMVLPVINSLVSENHLSNGLFIILDDLMGNPDKTNFLIYSVLVLSLVYLIKSLFLILISYKINRFTKNLLEYLTTTLYKSYIYNPYIFHINVNSSYLIKNILAESNHLTFAIISLIHIFSELILLIFFLIFLMIYDPLLTIGLLLFLVFAGSAIIFLSKGKIGRIGAKRQKFDTQRFKILQKSFGASIKIVKLLGLEKSYFKEYSDIASKYASITTLQLFIQSLPRVFFELLFIFGVSSLIIILVHTDHSLNEIVITLGVFGVVFFRLVPSFTKVLTNYNSMRFARDGIETINKEFQKIVSIEDTEEVITKISFKNKLVLENVSFKFPRVDTNLFDKFNLKIKKGNFVGIIGPSGSGKTTLVNLISGLISLKDGDILVDDASLKGRFKSWQKNIGYVPQQVYLDDESIKRNVAIGYKDDEIDEKKVIDSLDKAQLLNFVKKQINGIDTQVGEMGSLVSGGQLQRLGIARALYREPEVLILDESTSNLDLKTEDEIINTIKNLKKDNLTIICVSHRLSTLKFCDQIVDLKK